MKKSTKIFLSAALSVAILAGCLVGAGSIVRKNAELLYTGVKIYIDGGEIVPKDALGNVVEPFIMNGTTYLPVRAVGNAFGKDVQWDGDTQSVYIGKKDQNQPDTYLDKLQYNHYQEDRSRFDFTIINGTVTDINKVVYNNGMMFYMDKNLGGDNIKDDSDHPDILIGYPLNSQYRKLAGKIVLPKEYKMAAWSGEKTRLEAGMTNVWFYGDEELLYKATGVTPSMAFNFDIDVTGINQLIIKVWSEGYESYVALTDLALYEIE